MITFTFWLLYVILPYQSHTGEALARAFQNMLITHGLKNRVCYCSLSSVRGDLIPLQILAFTGDNATSNDKQTTFLDRLPNAFEDINRVRCFNHTMQLSAKALIKPFDVSTTVAASDSTDEPADADDMLSIEEGNDAEAEEDGEGDTDSDSVSGNDQDEQDAEYDDIDAFETLDPEAQQELLEATAAVRTTLDKVRAHLYFVVSASAHILIRSESFRLPSYTPPHRDFLRGAKPVPRTVYPFASSLVTSGLAGTLCMTCSRWRLGTAQRLMTLPQTRRSSYETMSWMMKTGRSYPISFGY